MSKSTKNRSLSTQERPNAPASDTSLPAPTSAIREKVEAEIGPLVQSGARVQVVERVTTMVASEIFRGPIPHPKHIQAYEDACPGAAARLIGMAEYAQQKREERKDTELRYEYQDRRFGMSLGFAALVVLVIGGIVSLGMGQNVAGGGLLTAAVVGTAIGTFVNGRKPSDQPEKKNEPPSNERRG